jgi:hypothetical protein
MRMRGGAFCFGLRGLRNWLPLGVVVDGFVFITLHPPPFFFLDVVDTHCSGKRERERDRERKLSGFAVVCWHISVQTCSLVQF